MKFRLLHSWWMFAVALILIGTACGPKAPKADDGTEKTAKEILAEWPATKSVIDAMTKKDYQTALQEYGKLVGEASTEVQQGAVRRVANYSLNILAENREKDPKAEEAYNAFRTFLMGR